MLKDALKKNAEFIVGIIGNDDFPGSVTPLFLRDAVRDYPLRGGKRLRSALLLWSCGLLGGNPESAKFAAAAVEIYHNWTLVHDDIIDDDDVRRHQPSSHCQLAAFAENEYNLQTPQSEKFGRDFAILAGDIQQGWAVNMLGRSIETGVSEDTILYLIRELQEGVNRQLISGEALDVKFSYQKWNEISPEDVDKMIGLKTGILLEFCARAGGVIALGAKCADDDRIKNIAKFAFNAGIAFQLRDDWLGIFGDEVAVGKPLASDLMEAKPTILFLDTLNSLSGYDASRFKDFVGRNSYSGENIAEIRALIRESGAEERLLNRSEALLQTAKDTLSAFPGSKYKTLLSEFADFMLGRDI